jgi:hypothetical protein
VPGPRGRRRLKGVCPVCRGSFALRDADGKLMPHGKTAAAPRGCAGVGEPPVREQAGTMRAGVAPIRPVVPHDSAPLPDLGIEVKVERRDDQGPPVHTRPRPDGPGAA